MPSRKKGIALAILLFSFFLLPANPLFAEEKGKRAPLKIEGKSLLPLRVLSRAFSNIYKDADVKSGTVEENVPAFQSFFVYAKKSSNSDLEEMSWYEVGSDNRGTVIGWMHSNDVFEWKQTMCLSYTHPEGRNPVLMFDKKEGLTKVTGLTADQRKQAVNKLYADINQGAVGADFPVITVEPKMAVDIAKEFYLLPILDFDEIELNNREARILKLAAVTKGGAKARESSDIRKNPEYLQSAVTETQQAGNKVAEKLTIDVVWVMDTTNSMKPYISQTLKVVKDASKRITDNPKLADAVRFGIWGYRDSMEIPGIGYNVKNYTPDLQNVADFTTTLKTVDITPAGSLGYAEDMFSGINGAIDQTSWTLNAIKWIILVGDAPSHETGHKWNASAQSEETLRVIANDRNISIFSIHIKDPKAEKYHELAEGQFSELSMNQGVNDATYFSLSSDDLAGFEQATQDVSNVIITLLEEARLLTEKLGSSTDTVAMKKKANAAPVAASIAASAPAVTTSDFDEPLALDIFAEPVPAEDEEQPTAETLAKAALKAAFVQWIGSQAGAQAPRDVVAWVTDKDLVETDIQALEVRLLVNKRQLDALRATLNTILLAGRTGQISGDDFFSSLQAAAATTARNPEMIKRATSLADSGLVPEFLAGLPYTSRIMDMNSELWSSWSIDEQDMFLTDLEARIIAYETIHDAPDGWVQLNRSDDPGEYVYPITLELLP